jgi:hypothetical protein
MRRVLLAMGAAAALAAAAIPTTASAQRHHFGGGHFGHGGHFRHFGGPSFSFGLGVPLYGGYYDYGYADSCYRLERVRTPYGWRTHRVWVC